MEKPAQERLFIAPEGIIRAVINHLENNPSPNTPVREVMALIHALSQLQVATVMPTPATESEEDSQ